MWIEPLPSTGTRIRRSPAGVPCVRGDPGDEVSLSVGADRTLIVDHRGKSIARLTSSLFDFLDSEGLRDVERIERMWVGQLSSCPGDPVWTEISGSAVEDSGSCRPSQDWEPSNDDRTSGALRGPRRSRRCVEARPRRTAEDHEVITDRPSQTTWPERSHAPSRTDPDPIEDRDLPDKMRSRGRIDRDRDSARLVAIACPPLGVTFAVDTSACSPSVAQVHSGDTLRASA